MREASSTGPPQRKAQVLLVNNPRSYREAMAAVIRHARPDVVVETADPEALDAFMTSPGPDMVVCSEATDALIESVPVWVELYRDHGSLSLASIRGDLEEHDNIELPDLLALVDRALDPL